MSDKFDLAGNSCTFKKRIIRVSSYLWNIDPVKLKDVIYCTIDKDLYNRYIIKHFDRKILFIIQSRNIWLTKYE